jgi:lipoprotein signal peptidase
MGLTLFVDRVDAIAPPIAMAVLDAPQVGIYREGVRSIANRPSFEKRSIMRERSYLWLLLILAGVGCTVDLASKYAVFGWLATVDSHTYALFQTAPESRWFAIVPLAEDPFERMKQQGFFLEVAFEPRQGESDPFIPHVNQGALFGLGREHKTIANLIFAAISLAAAGGILLWATLWGGARDRWLSIALGLILGGCLGNLYDRLVFNGVRDFLHWNYLFDWPVFNIADCCLVVGAGMLLLQAFFVPPAPSKDSEQSQQEKTQVVQLGSTVKNGSTV